MSGQPSAGTRRGLLLDILIFGVGGTIFLLAGLFSNFYTSSSIEILIVVQAGLMAAYGVLAFKSAKDEEGTKNLIDQSIRLGFIYSVGVVLMLVNAKVSVYSLEIYTAPMGYFVCIASYLGFAAYYVKMKHSLKVDIARSIGAVLLVGVVAISIVFLASGVITFAFTFTELWILIAAILLGIAFTLIVRGLLAPKHPEKPEVMKPAIPIHLETETTNTIDLCTRDELDQKYPLRDYLLQAKEKIDLYGLTMEKIALHQTEIRELLKGGRTVNLIVTNPFKRQLISYVEKAYSTTNLKGVIKRTLGNFNKMKKENNFEKLRIYTSDLFPFLSVIVIDDSTVQVESYLYNQVDPNRRLVAIISKSKAPELFKTYKEVFDFVHRGAQQYKRT